MRKVLLITFLWSVVMLFGMCSNQNVRYVSEGDVPSLSLDKEPSLQGFRLSGVFDSVRVIPLDNREMLLSGVERFDVYGDRLVVMDNFMTGQGIGLFDRKGRLVRQVGRQGMGPGEYRRCCDFAIDREEGAAYVCDDMGRQILVYRLSDGRHLRTLPFPKGLMPSRVWCKDGSLYALKTFFHMDKEYEQGYMLYQLDKSDGKILRKWFHCQEYNKGWPDEYVMSNAFYHVSGGKDLFAFGLMDTIMCLERNRIYPYLTFNGKKVLKKEEVSALMKNVNMADPSARSEAASRMLMDLGMKGGKMLNLSDLFEHRGVLYFNYASMARYPMAYNGKTGELAVYAGMTDDVLFKDRMPDGFTFFTFLGADEGGVYYTLSLDSQSELAAAAGHGLLTGKVCNAEVLRSLDADSNPVILYYEFK